MKNRLASPFGTYGPVLTAFLELIRVMTRQTRLNTISLGTRQPMSMSSTVNMGFLAVILAVFALPGHRADQPNLKSNSCSTYDASSAPLGDETGLRTAEHICSCDSVGTNDELIEITCIPERKIETEIELSDRDGTYIRSELTFCLILNHEPDDIKIPDVLGSMHLGKRLKFIVQVKEAPVNTYELQEIWDGNLKIFPAKSLQQIEKEMADRSANEIPFPNDELWVEHEGLEYQLTTSTPILLTTANSFVFYLWIRNSSIETKNVRVVSHPKFLTHFDLVITSESGESMMIGECLKKHDFKRVAFAPGQMRGFRLDAFEGWCRRLERLPKIPSSFTLNYRGAKLVVMTKLR